MSRVLVLGADGYIGSSLFKHLETHGYEVLGVDNGLRERNVRVIGSDSLTPFKRRSRVNLDVSSEEAGLEKLIQDFSPDAVVNLAQQPSAPFSMLGPEEAADTQRNNLCGNMNLLWAVKNKKPDTHIIQLGTAGEYPDWLYEGIEVPEGSRVEVNYKGVPWTIPTPRYAGSWYHFSKLYSSYNADYACRIWGLRVTDINQGIVYGHVDGTRFDYDEYFGTVVNRFVTQAVAGIPITIYGDKGGQVRSFINLRNVLEAVELLIKNPAQKGEYRIIQQLTETHSVKDVAIMVQDLTDCAIQFVPNPRAEMEQNLFVFEAKKLKTLGLKTVHMHEELPRLLRMVEKNRNRIDKAVILPTHSWK